MSVEIIESSTSLPMNSRCETINLSSDSVSKCGEIFISNAVDQWTFLCSFCQKASNDIGVFICHIRWEHLNHPAALMQQQESQQIPLESQNVFTTFGSSMQNGEHLQPSVTSMQITEEFSEKELQIHDSKQLALSNIVEEEEFISNNQEESEKTICSRLANIVDITPLTQPKGNEMDNFTAGQTSITTNNNVMQVVYISDENEIFDIRAKDETNANDTDTIYSVSDQDEFYESEDPALKRKLETDMSPISSTVNNEAASESEHLLPHKCRFCSRRFKSKQGLDFHANRSHKKLLLKKLPYKCSECKRAFKSSQGLSYHKIKHDTKSHFKCPLCPVVRYKRSMLIDHVLLHESNECFPCQACGKVYESENERMKHWKTHDEDKPFSCQFCYRRFRQQSYLTHHLKSHNRYLCTICQVEFNPTETQRPPYVCENCNSNAADKQNAMKIVNLDDKTATSDTTTISETNKKDANDICDEDESYERKDPDLKSRVEKALHNSKSHKKRVLVNKSTLPHKCRYCNQAFKSKPGLYHHTSKIHEKDSHKKLPHKCDECARGFQTKQGLTSHKITHDTKNHYKCPLCPAIRNKHYLFIHHVLLHESSECFPCQVCAKVYESENERTQHWQTHAKERPYSCHICFRRFHKQMYLTHHLKSHNR